MSSLQPPVFATKIIYLSQNLYSIQHCFKISFAVCLDLIFPSTVTYILVAG